ncbi:MAG: aminodeoxychorismate synthase component I [Pyrinomonadaceae bacterium]
MPLSVFDFADERGQARRLCFAAPVKIIAAESVAGVSDALAQVEEAARAGYYAAGYVAYEAAPAFDPALVVRVGAKAPLVWFGIYTAPVPDPSPAPTRPFELTDWTPSADPEAYARNFAAAREAIARGDSYQINYTIRLRARFSGDDFALYEQLASRQQSAYCAYLNTGRFKILSASPELFFRWHDGRIVTRPMKGTARRGRWLEEDEAYASWLANSEKNRAENVMIVDLLRNDLGRIAETGSVRVRDLCTVERYPTVFQMVSEVEARTRARTTLGDVFAALFPCGSVTGAPKISTTRLIAALEDSPRGVYCGAVGIVSPGGGAVFNVAIRTVVIHSETGEAEYGVGGGITWDSVAEEEYDEALVKAALLTAAPREFELLETLRLEGGDYTLLARHLARLADSARYFDFDFSPEAARDALSDHAARHPYGAQRTRLLAARDGGLRVESEPLENPHAGPRPVALADTPVRRHDPLLCHKTTSREVYDSHRAQHPDAFDVLLWNEEGEVTEFTNGNLVAELCGERLTPARGCGLLAGTMRAELLERGEIREAMITRADLARATRMWFINSVRGWVGVYLTG